ncbi:hypothetical protein ACRRTK_022578 [Alexandromys fortis]
MRRTEMENWNPWNWSAAALVLPLVNHDPSKCSTPRLKRTSISPYRNARDQTYSTWATSRRFSIFKNTNLTQCV